MKSRVIATGLALLVGTGLWAATVGATPTPESRRAIQQMINRGTAQRATFVKKRADFVKSFKAWKKDSTEANRQAAIAQRDSMRQAREKVKANRDSVIAKVDSTFDTNEPAGTNVQYDPDCTDYGYTSSRCFVRICEPSFESPDDVATTKIHEFEHVRQKQAGRWGPGNTPQPCTFTYHQLEFEAYEAEMDADFGKRTSLSTEVKLDLLQRKAEHLRGMLEDLRVKVTADKLQRALPGSEVETQVTVINDAEMERPVTGSFADPLGWTITPPTFSCLLAAEQDTTFPMTVQVPPGTIPGTATEVMGQALASGTPAWDFFFIHAVPTVDVTKGANVSGPPEDWVDVHFTVQNRGPSPGQFDALVTSTLGWPLTSSHWLLTLGPGESRDLLTHVQIPEGAPHVTDLLLCTAFALSDPAQMDHDWLYAETEKGTSDVRGDETWPLALATIAPNPLVTGAQLRFTLPAAGPVDLGVYDVAGRRVRTLMSRADGAVSPGVHAVRWDGADDRGVRLASGVYFVRLHACDRGAVRRIVVLH
jgi:hypothetical protein